MLPTDSGGIRRPVGDFPEADLWLASWPFIVSYVRLALHKVFLSTGKI